MTKLINDLYYMVEYQIGQLDTQTETEKELTERREALQDKIALRLGEDGQDMMEALNALYFKRIIPLRNCFKNNHFPCILFQ